MAKQSPASAREARQTADDVVARITAMSPEERREFIAHYDKVMDALAPTRESAGSDLLALLNAVAAEFIRRYYPEATDASFHVTRHHGARASRAWSVMLPIACPKE